MGYLASLLTAAGAVWGHVVAFACAIWSFLNKPIIANSLAVFLVAFFGYWFTSYFQCKDRSWDDNLRLSRLFDEISWRHSELQSGINVSYVSLSAGFDRITRALTERDPDGRYKYLEFKGRTQNELKKYIEEIVLRWSILHKDPPETHGSQQDSPACSSHTVEQFDITSPCDTNFFNQFVMDTSVDFEKWLDNAVTAKSEGTSAQSKFVDFMKDKYENLLNFINKSSGSPSQLSKEVATMSTASREGKFFPRSMCRRWAFWH